MIKEFSAGIIVFSEYKGLREYLLLHYQAGHWDFPKGHIEKGETKEQAALRELYEETGLTAIILPGFHDSLSYVHHLPKTKQLAHKTVYFFVGKTDSNSVSLSHEHIDFIWLAYEKAMKQLTYDNARGLLKKAEMFLTKKK